jgi:hypothetical protein
MTLSLMTLSITKLYHYAECHCAECRDFLIGMLNVVRLSVVAPATKEALYFGTQNKNILRS